MTCHVARRMGEFERRLRRDRVQVQHDLAMTDDALVDHERHQPGEFIDDAATEVTCRTLLSLEARDRGALTEIDAAEGRLMKGDYGVCEACDRPIVVKRLRALPTARLCVSCEAMWEQGTRPRGRSMVFG